MNICYVSRVLDQIYFPACVLYVIQIVHKLLETILSNMNSHNFQNKYARIKTLQYYSQRNISYTNIILLTNGYKIHYACNLLI